MTIHIQIGKSPWAKGKWRIQIGDIKGSTEMSNVDIKEMLEQIEWEIKNYSEPEEFEEKIKKIREVLDKENGEKSK